MRLPPYYGQAVVLTIIIVSNYRVSSATGRNVRARLGMKFSSTKLVFCNYDCKGIPQTVKTLVADWACTIHCHSLAIQLNGNCPSVCLAAYYARAVKPKMLDFLYDRKPKQFKLYLRMINVAQLLTTISKLTRNNANPAAIAEVRKKLNM